MAVGILHTRRACAHARMHTPPSSAMPNPNPNPNTPAGIIHPASHPEDRPPPETEDDMYLSIFQVVVGVVLLVVVGSGGGGGGGGTRGSSSSSSSSSAHEHEHACMHVSTPARALYYPCIPIPSTFPLHSTSSAYSRRCAHANCCILKLVDTAAASATAAPHGHSCHTALGQRASPPPGQWPQPLRSHPPALQRSPQEGLRPTRLQVHGHRRRRAPRQDEPAARTPLQVRSG